MLEKIKKDIIDVLGRNISQQIISILAISFCVFQIYTGFSPLYAMDQRIIHVMCGFVLLFLVYNFRGQKVQEKLRPVDCFFAIVFTAISIFFLLTWRERASQIGGQLTYSDIIIGTIIMALTLEGARRSIGLVLPVMIISLFLFASYGEMLPGIFAHKDYPYNRIITAMTLKTEGLYGMLTGISASFVYLLILFGVLYTKSGAGAFFMQFANSLTGHFRGGTAKVAILASALFGMISGSGVANTAATGNMTIPYMKEEGYDNFFATAVVATAGSGGMIMPPIMGSTIFVMMSILGIPYLEIINRSFVIALLFYLALFLIVDLRSIRLGIVGKQKKDLPVTREVLKAGWNFFLPPVILITLLGFHFTIIQASLWGCICIPLAAALRPSTRMSLKLILESLRDASISAIPVIAILSVASIGVGLVDFTGLGLMISSVLIELSGGNLFFLLILTMIASIILGMGIPPVAAYIVLSILVCPALIRMGVWDFAAHMFVFYFAVMAEITPTVAPNIYVACGISGAPVMKTAWTAIKLAFPIILFPYAFVYNPAILMQGTLMEIAFTVFFAFLAVFLLSCGMEGYCFGEIGKIKRIILMVASIALIFPSWLISVPGFVVAIISVVVLKKKADEEVVGTYV
jgi:TRAP transporter 4TM/12TM fusion protein